MIGELDSRRDVWFVAQVRSSNVLECLLTDLIFALSFRVLVKRTVTTSTFATVASPSQKGCSENEQAVLNIVVTPFLQVSFLPFRQIGFSLRIACVRLFRSWIHV